MLKLSDYFQPLNFYTISQYLLLIFFFDVFGSTIKRIIVKTKKDDDTRILSWLIGLGLFVFIWFILGFFIPPTGNPVIYSIVFIFVVCLPSYIRNQEYKLLLKRLWSLKIPLLIISFFLPAVFVKASLPPYYSDEMAYHFLSPSDIQAFGVWRFTGGLYQNLPRLLDTFFILVFSITKTYSIVRLIQFSILVTSMVFAFSRLKLLFNFWVGIFFVFAFFSLPHNIVFTSTLGFVDVATYSFMLIAFLNLISFINKPSQKHILISSIFWAMALGTKYTPLTAFLVILIPFLVVVFAKKDKYLKFFNLKTLLLIVTLMLTFGGYWYIKNLVIYGNPTYPFIFPCTRYASEWCGATSNFFGNWTTKVTWENLKPIMDSMFPRNILLQLVILTLPVFVFLNKNRKTKIVSSVIMSAVILEFVIFKFVSGFYVRYHQHIQLWLLLLVAIQLANKYSNSYRKILTSLIYFVLMISFIVSFVNTVKHTNSLKFLNWQEINYSVGKINIYDWIDWKFPEMKSVISWCENSPDGEKQRLARFDPDMIWYTYGGFMRSFMTNCYYANPPLEGVPLEKVLDVSKEKEMQFWIGTPKECVADEEVKPTRPGVEDERKMYSRRLNNIIICNSEQITKSLYYFDYQKLE